MNIDELHLDLRQACRTEVQRVREACLILSEDGEFDFSLKKLADAVGGTTGYTADREREAIIIGPFTVPMDGSMWKEMGNQYSLLKQWGPL